MFLQIKEQNIHGTLLLQSKKMLKGYIWKTNL